MPTFREDQLERHLRLGEDSRWEFKSVEFAGRRLTSPRRDDLADEIAAFANSTAASCSAASPTTAMCPA